MKITKIEIQKKNNKRASIFIDDEFAFGLNIETVYDFGLSKNTEVDEEFINNVLRKEEQRKANTYALKLLSFSSRSEHEIRDKMLQKEYDEEIIDNTISFLKGYGYIDDNKFVHSFIKNKIEFNKYGLNRIKNDLYKKGINRELIEAALYEYIDEDREYENVKELALKKIKSYEKDSKDAKYRKLSGFLLRKGYSYDVVSKVVRELLK